MPVSEADIKYGKLFALRVDVDRDMLAAINAARGGNIKDASTLCKQARLHLTAQPYLPVQYAAWASMPNACSISSVISCSVQAEDAYHRAGTPTCFTEECKASVPLVQKELK